MTFYRIHYDFTDLSEWDATVTVLVDFLNHRFQAEMCLRCAQHFHHSFQFREVQKTVFAIVESENIKIS